MVMFKKCKIYIIFTNHLNFYKKLLLKTTLWALSRMHKNVFRGTDFKKYSGPPYYCFAGVLSPPPSTPIQRGLFAWGQNFVDQALYLSLGLSVTYRHLLVLTIHFIVRNATV